MTSNQYVEKYYEEHNCYPLYDERPENAAFRERYEILRNRYEKNYVLNHISIGYKDLHKLCRMHKMASKRGDWARCLAIEDTLANVNYHAEAGLLRNGDDDNFVRMVIMKEHEEEKEIQRGKMLPEETIVIKAFDDCGFKVGEVEVHGSRRYLEVETWTELGVDMVHVVEPVNKEGVYRLWQDFDVDGEIDIHRQDPEYKSHFRITQSVKDFTEHEELLEQVYDRVCELMQEKSDDETKES